ncbi:hypothetical protein ACFFRR_005803 [Megaselia abdita]
MDFKLLIIFLYFGLSKSVKVNTDSAYDHFHEFAKDKRQTGHDGNPQQRQLVFIHPGVYKHRSVNNQDYQQEDNDYARNLFYPQQTQENPYILYANKYQQDSPTETIPAPTRRLIDQQPKNIVDKQNPKHSNVFLPLEHRQVESTKPQRLIPEEQLLKLIEDELAARGFPLASRPFPTPGQSQLQIQSSPQNIVAEIANKAKEVIPAYRTVPGHFVPIHYQPFGAYNNQNGKPELKINNIEKSISSSKLEETKQLANHGQRLQQKSSHSTPIPPFLENYNFIPFAQLNGYSSTPQPSKAVFTTAIPKQFVTENRLLKSTAPQTFIGFNDQQNQNKQITASTPRNNPYFASQQYINPYIENPQKKQSLSKKDAIVAGPLYASQRQLYHQDENLNRNQPIPPSQSTIFVSQETGINQGHLKSNNKKQYKVPNFGNKPLSPEEFQALVDAGYPVTAVPVPVPVPYDEYVKQQQRLIEIPLKPKQPTKLSQQSKLPNFLEPVHIQQQKQQEHNGGTVVSQNL